MKKVLKKIIVFIILLEVFGYIFYSLRTIKQNEKILFESEYNFYSWGSGAKEFRYKIYRNGLVIRQYDKFYWIDYIGTVNTTILNLLSAQINNEYHKCSVYTPIFDGGDSQTDFYSKKEDRLISLASGDISFGYWKFYGEDYYKRVEKNDARFIWVRGSNTSNIAKIVIYYTKALYYLFFIKIAFIIFGIIIFIISKIIKHKKEKNIVEN